MKILSFFFVVFFLSIFGRLRKIFEKEKLNYNDGGKESEKEFLTRGGSGVNMNLLCWKGNAQKLQKKKKKVYREK